MNLLRIGLRTQKERISKRETEERDSKRTMLSEGGRIVSGYLDSGQNINTPTPRKLFQPFTLLEFRRLGRIPNDVKERGGGEI